LGLIRSLIGANQVAEARREIEDLKSTTCQKSQACQIKADLLLSDIAIYREDWAEAEKIFNQMKKTYPIEEVKEERYFYNYASVLFRQKKFLDALDMYLEFITRYPNDQFAGYALTRIGEIIDVNSTNYNRAIGAYLEANFRYGTQVGSTALFARIRLLEKQLASLKGRSRQVAINEILELSKKAKLPLAEDFGNFIVSEALQKSGEYDQALSYLVDNYRSRPNHPLSKKYFEIIQDIQSKKLVLMSSKKPFEALKYHELMQIDWLKDTKRPDVSYALAESYYNLGDYKTAEKNYQITIDLISSFNFDTIQNQVFLKKQNLPSLSYLLLRLADAQKLQKKWQSVETTIGKLDSLGLNLSQKEQIERASLLAQVLQEKGQSEYALRYLHDMKKMSSGNSTRDGEILFKELDALKRIGDNKGIVEISSSLDQVCENPEWISNCYKAGRDVLAAKKVTMGQDAYSQALQRFLDQYADYGNVDDLRYELGKIHLKNKNIKQAESVWSQFKDLESGWAQLAKSDLEGAKFDSTYQDYFKKIPSLSRSPATSEEKVNE
jgi:TolA-binding protein